MVTRPLAKERNALTIPENCSLRDYLAVKGNNRDAGHQAKKLRTELQAPLLANGCCGEIMRSMKIKVKDDVIDWHFLHPVSLLHELTKRCSKLGDLIKSGGRARICIYMDEIKPGNVLRPDPSRSIAMWYWTLMGLPDWLRSTTNGWFYFAAFPTKWIKDVQGNYSYLFARMMEIFLELEEPFTFTSGFPCHSTSGLFLCQGGFQALLSDEKAISQLWSLRGASGTKPCVLCQNVVGHMKRETVSGHPWLVHFSCSDCSKFAKQSSSTFQEMRNNLESVAWNKKECDRLGQAYGLVYKKNGILWHSSLRQYVDPVQHTFYDWLHVLLTSGGLAQYEINEFVKVLEVNNIGLAQLDSFQQGVRSPKSLDKLPKNFFAERIVKDDGAHIRCFAGELLVAIPALALFNDLVLEPLGILREHRLCFQELFNIIGILKKLDGALQLLPQLKKSISTHNELFCKLYPNCAKPKFHWLFHVPENLEQFKVNMNCLCPERKHRAMKTVASHVFNDLLTLHLTTRIGSDSLSMFEASDACEPIRLDGPAHEVPEGAEMLSYWSDDIVRAKHAKRLHTETGLVCLGDIVLAPRRRQLLVPYLFLEVTSMSGKKTFLVQADCHLHKEGALFEGSSNSSGFFVWESDFIPVSYIVKSSGLFHVVLHRQGVLALSKS